MSSLGLPKKKKVYFTFKEVGDLQSGFYPTPVGKETRREECEINNAAKHIPKHTFLGLLAKIKCSICTYNGEEPVSVA